MGWTFEMLARAERTKHEELIRTCPGPSFSSIVGWEWRGWNVLYPLPMVYMRLAGYRRFMKGFFRRAGEGDVEDADVLHGYNLNVTRGRLEDPWTEKKKGLEPHRHAFYDVYRPGGGGKERFGEYAQACFLNYAVSENGLFDGKNVRDFLVEVEPDLLLGKAYMKLFGIRFPASFFILERLREHTFLR